MVVPFVSFFQHKRIVPCVLFLFFDDGAICFIFYFIHNAVNNKLTLHELFVCSIRDNLCLSKIKSPTDQGAYDRDHFSEIDKPFFTKFC